MDIFFYLLPHRVFVCCLCSQVISPAHIQNHVQRQESHRLRQHSRRVQEFREFFQRHPDQLADIHHLTIPSTPIKVIPQLAPPQTGFRCQSDPYHCQYICCDPRTIQKHCRDQHQWKASRQRGRRPKRAPNASQVLSDVPWRIVVTQRFTPKGRLSRYFEVLGDQPSAVSSSKPSPDQQYAEKKRQIQNRVRDVMDRERQAISDGHRTEVNAWLEMTGWVAHLQPYQRCRVQLCSLLEIPSVDSDHEQSRNPLSSRGQKKQRRMNHASAEGDLKQLFNTDDQVLALICAHFDEIIRVGQHTVMEKVNWFVRFEINKKEQAKAERRPFHARLLDATLTRYRYVWKQLICYIVRSTVLQQRDAAPEDGSGKIDSEEDSGEAILRQPRFSLTSQQQTLYDEMWQCCSSSLQSGHTPPTDGDEGAPSYTLQPTQRVLLRFLVSLLDHQIHGNEFESGILSGLAVLGLDPDTGWVDAFNYTPKLSAVVKLARILVVQQAWEKSSACCADQAPSCLEEVQRSVRRFMVIDQPVPMSRIYHIRTYGLRIRYTTTADGRIDWVGQGRQSRLLYDGIEFTKEQFEAMIRGLLYDCRQKLMKDLLLLREEEDHPTAPLPSIPWDDLRDNPSSDVPGWNFTRDQRTPWPDIDAEWWLWERIHHRPEFRRQFLHHAQQAGPQRFRQGALKEWFLSLRRYKELLLILVHLCGGQPARGSEILSVKHSNTVRSRRNIFIEDGMVVYVTEYHKGYSISGNTKIIHRYLPREVGELLVYYIWLVLPFERQISVEELHAQELSPFLWTLDGAAPGRDTWHVEDMTKILQCESAQRMGPLGRLGVASYRHCAIALSRRFCGDHGVQAEEGDEEEQEEDETTWYSGHDAARDLQAGHGTHVAGITYARGIQEASGVIASIRAQFRQESRRWHAQVLGFKPYFHDSIMRKRIHAATSDAGRKRQRQQYLAAKSVDLTVQLHRLLGSHAEFRGPQERAIQAIMNQEDPVICVMGTGGGKSLLFILPAFCQRDLTTVVVVPTVALRADMIRRCQEDGITCHEWQDAPPAHAVQIVFVTPESTASNRFQSYVNILRREGSLARLVVDECHVVLDSTLTFRPLLQELGSLLRFGVQMVYLTATLPPEDEPRLFELMQIDPYRTHVLRASTVRPNIRYRVHQYDGTVSSAVAFLQQELQQCRAMSGCLIVYSNRIARVQELASALGCPAYHGDMAAEERRDVYGRLRAGQVDLVVATNGLGVGIDVPNIYSVVHAEVPYKLRDYGQESGRAGRDGTVSRATILQPSAAPAVVDWRTRPSHRHPAPVGNGGETQMQAFCRGDRCRRVILDEYMDGQAAGRRDRTQCEEDEAACDVCEQRQSRLRHAQRMEAQQHAEHDARLRRRQDWQEQVHRLGMAQEVAVTDIESMLAHWHGKCSVCYVRQEADVKHTLEQCRRAEQGVVWAETRRMVAGISYANYSACFDCGVPQAICAQFEPHPRIPGRFKRREDDGHCQYPGTVIPVVVAILVEGRQEWSDVIYGWLAADRVDYENDAGAVMKWFAQKVHWGGIEMCMLMKVFCVLVRLAGM